jgi:hypothetical protein
MPGISIVTPTFNRAPLLERVWASLRKQTFANFEWIVVDDGSTDNTADTLKALDDTRIKYVYQKNGGVSAARNTGERHITGEFVVFLDSDDELFDEQTLTAMESELRAAGPGVGAVAFTVKVTGDANVTSLVPKPKMLAHYAEIVCDQGARGEFIFLFRREAVAVRPWPDTPCAESLKLWGIAKKYPFLFVNRHGRIYHTSVGDNLTQPSNTVRLAPLIARGLEALIAEHRAVWIEHCPEMYGRHLCNLALNQVLANQDLASAKTLLEAWRHHGSKLRIAALTAGLMLGPSLRQKLFLAAARRKRTH